MNNGFICESAHIDELDPAFADLPFCGRVGTTRSSGTC